MTERAERLRERIRNLTWTADEEFEVVVLRAVVEELGLRHATKDVGGLLPCPFCGNEARIKAMRSGEDSMDTWVECTACFVRTDPVDAPYSEPEMAAHAWNDRQQAAIATLLEASGAER